MKNLLSILILLLSFFCCAQSISPEVIINQSVSILGRDQIALEDFAVDMEPIDTLKVPGGVIKMFNLESDVDLYVVLEKNSITTVSLWLKSDKSVNRYAMYLEQNYKIRKKEALGFQFASKDDEHLISFYRSLTESVVKLTITKP